MADVHFRVPYGLMSPHRYFGDSWVHRAREHSQGAIYGVRLAQYCDQDILLSRYFTWIAPQWLCSLALRLRNTKVLVWTHESIGYPKMDISHWDAAIHYGVQPNIVIKPDLELFHAEIAPCEFPSLRLRSTKVPVWTHESIGYPVDLSLRAREYTGGDLREIALSTR